MKQIREEIDKKLVEDLTKAIKTMDELKDQVKGATTALNDIRKILFEYEFINWIQKSGILKQNICQCYVSTESPKYSEYMKHIAREHPEVKALWALQKDHPATKTGQS